MVIIGVDYGDARTGVAASDPSEMMAFGAGCVKAEGMRKAAAGVSEIAKSKGAGLIVVGNPLNMNGSEGPRSEKCRAFAAMVGEVSGLPVELFDERLTTVSAHRILSESNVRGQKRKNSVDELSAQLILEAYLERRRITGK